MFEGWLFRKSRVGIEEFQKKERMMLTTDFTKRSHPIKALVGIRTLIGSLALFMSMNGLADSPDTQPGETSGTLMLMSAEQQATQQRVDAIFADDADVAELGSDRCLPARRIRDVDVLDRRTLVFDMGRKDNYLVRLKRQCFGLRRNTPISYEIHGGRLCRLDGIRELETWGFNRFVQGPRCTIPSFIKVSEAELELVEARIDAARASRTAQRDADKAARRAAKAAREQADAQRSSDASVGG